MRYFLILIIVLVGCGKRDSDHSFRFSLTTDGAKVREVDATLEPFVGSFEDEWRQKIAFKVAFGNLDTGSAGHCLEWTNNDKLVEIDRVYFQTLNKDQQEALVWHELGHCALGLDHDEKLVIFPDIAGAWPNSVMKSVVFSVLEAQVFVLKKSHYIKTLF